MAPEPAAWTSEVQVSSASGEDDAEPMAGTAVRAGWTCCRSLPLASVGWSLVAWTGWGMYQAGGQALAGSVDIWPDVIFKLAHAYSVGLWVSVVSTLIFGVLCTGWGGEQLSQLKFGDAASSPKRSGECSSRCLARTLFHGCFAAVHWGFGALNFLALVFSLAILMGAVVVLALTLLLKASCEIGADGQDALCMLFSEMHENEDDNDYVSAITTISGGDLFGKVCVCTGLVIGHHCSAKWTVTESMAEFCKEKSDQSRYAMQFSVGVLISIVGMVGLLCVLLRARQRLGDLGEATVQPTTVLGDSSETAKVVDEGDGQVPLDVAHKSNPDRIGVVPADTSQLTVQEGRSEMDGPVTSEDCPSTVVK